MCQRATGNAFAPLVEVDDDRIAWTGRTGTFRSSSIAERGFCPACGTPLFYRRLGRGTTELMAGTIEPPFAYAPVANHGIESRQPWLPGLAALPGRETVFTSGERVVSHQWEYRA